MTTVAIHEVVEITRPNHSGFLQPLHRMVENLIDVSIRQGSRAHLEAVIDRGVKDVDDCVRVCVRAQQSIPDSLLKIRNRHSPSRHCPSVTQFNGEPGIELGLGEQRSDESPVLAAEDLRHRAHLQPYALRVTPGGQEKRTWVHAGNKRVHDDRGLVAPPPVDRHAADVGSGGDIVHADGPEAAFQHQIDRGLQDCLLNARASGAAYSRGLRSCLLSHRFHCAPKEKGKLLNPEWYIAYRKECYGYDTTRLV